MRQLFIVASFMAALLLFMVQPLAGKALLPTAGSSPAVWTTSMLFFQAALLAGYALAHACRARPDSRAQMWVIVILLVASAAGSWALWPPFQPASWTQGWLPGSGRAGLSASGGIRSNLGPTLWVLTTLAVSVGPAFVSLATLSPTLQHWFSLAQPTANPFQLSVASNIGSAAGLLGYILLVERTLGIASQWRWWLVGVGVCALLVLVCAWLSRLRRQELWAQPAPSCRQGKRVSWRRRVQWLVLAFVPTSLMLGATQHITTDIAPLPLLWVVPLLTLLLTFAWSFADVRQPSSHWWARALLVPLLLLAFAGLVQARTPVALLLGLHLLVLFMGCMLCHRALSQARPAPRQLTQFYFTLALGGVLAGVANALLAPLTFSRVLEYPLTLSALALLALSAAAGRPRYGQRAGLRALTTSDIFTPGVACALGVPVLVTLLAALDQTLSRHELTQFARSAWIGAAPVLTLLVLMVAARASRQRLAIIITLLASLFIAPMWFQGDARVLYQTRTFFGVHRVVRTADGQWHELRHGTTAHGTQAAGRDAPPDSAAAGRFERLRVLPGAYYHPTGPAGSLLRARQEQQAAMRVGVVGLGAGALAAYARAGDQYTFFEIDPSVVRIVEHAPWFTFVTDARERGAHVAMVIGDGRLTLASSCDAFDVLIIDAFSSDAIPTHLLTREALDIYRARLAPGGVLAFHISNRSFNLSPVLSRHAAQTGLLARTWPDVSVSRAELDEGKLESWWFALAEQQDALGSPRRAANWYVPDELRAFETGTSDLHAIGPWWTDERTDLLRVLLAW